MSKIDLIKASTDLGVHIDGAELGPSIICNNIDLGKFNHIYEVKKTNIEKELDSSNKKKNFEAVNQFNEKLYDTVLKSIKDGNVPLTIGGDHSLAIGSALASKKRFNQIGLIWFDAHADFHTLGTTVTGNLHGLPFASITGQNGNFLSNFFDGDFFSPQKSVLIGARSIDIPGEVENLKQAGIKVFTTEDIQKHGIQSIFDEAIKIVTTHTDGFHFSIDVDVMDPKIAPGVSVPEVEGITEDEFLGMIQLLMQYHDKMKSVDLVEYNPKYDSNQKTLKIILKALDKIVEWK